MTGIEAALTKDDAVITSYRDHCQHLSRGGTIKEVMAELMGKRDGATRGLGGSMHMCGGAMLWSTSAHSGWHATGQRSSHMPVVCLYAAQFVCVCVCGGGGGICRLCCDGVSPIHHAP
jgi:TPP-dependent pyruvate/acetoin dehydrogenase alpha subunit